MRTDKLLPGGRRLTLGSRRHAMTFQVIARRLVTERVPEVGEGADPWHPLGSSSEIQEAVDTLIHGVYAPAEHLTDQYVEVGLTLPHPATHVQVGQRRATPCAAALRWSCHAVSMGPPLPPALAGPAPHRPLRVHARF